MKTKIANIISVAHEMPAGTQQPEEIPVPYGIRKTLAMGPEVGEIEEAFGRHGAEAFAADLAARAGKKGFKGYPVYHGHPDAPAPVGSKYPNKAAVGWITACEPGGSEAVFHVRWLANPGEGFSHFSPYWGGTFDASKKLLIVTKFKSLGLTNDPDYEDMALPHEGDGGERDPGTPGNDETKETRMDPKVIAKLLGLPETATEEEIKAALDAALKAKAEAEALAKTAGEEKKNAATALEHERGAHRKTILDRAVADGRITAAERGTWETRLSHEKSFAGEAAALEALPSKLKTEPSSAKGGRGAFPGRDQVIALAHEKMAGDKGLDFNAAYQAVKAERPDLWVAGGKGGEA